MPNQSSNNDHTIITSFSSEKYRKFGPKLCDYINISLRRVIWSCYYVTMVVTTIIKTERNAGWKNTSYFLYSQQLAKGRHYTLWHRRDCIYADFCFEIFYSFIQWKKIRFIQSLTNTNKQKNRKYFYNFSEFLAFLIIFFINSRNNQTETIKENTKNKNYEL